ncbi:HD domain-containing protein [Methanoplanus limicola]|uniref:Metal dependent phosphohydrolase n=1 Tax=Methanoplanus limicola DSM 2279 TaxID=937775 RepID=H1Z0B0_9EURY|nr:HD domain-containing protein [Methanoplanus limicola]EHQ34377.1 metal dependent phosphohydrolase [Methanoplanus limicola DSM 2279]
MKVIRDVVHGYIELCDDDIRIIDTPHFQRLKSIKQNNPFSAYPCANHTRFEHSLGVMHLGVKVFKSLKEKEDENNKNLLNDKSEKTVKYACLLHDVGHAPFSHYGEQFFDRDELKDLFSEKLKERDIDKAIAYENAGAPHEICSCILSLDKYGDLLENIGVDLELFCRMIIGMYYPPEKNDYRNLLIDILNSNIDVDKLDYVLRDSYMSGAKLVVLDVDRLISAYMIYDERIAFSGKSLSTISNLIYGREAVYTWIVNHHVNVYTGRVLTKLIKTAFQTEEDEADYFSYNAVSERLVDDHDIVSFIRSKRTEDQKIGDLYEQLFSRKFFKSVWKNEPEFNKCIPNEVRQNDFKSIIGENLQDPDSAEEVIAEKISVKPEDILISVADFKPFEPFGLTASRNKRHPVYIIINGEPVTFEKIFTGTIHKNREPLLPLLFVRTEDAKTKFLEEYGR